MFNLHGILMMRVKQNITIFTKQPLKHLIYQKHSVVFSNSAKTLLENELYWGLADELIIGATVKAGTSRIA